MGIFDFFKKAHTSGAPEQQATPLSDDNYLLETLKGRLTSMGYQVEKNPEYLALTVNSQLEIATLIIQNPESHPSIVQVVVFTIHPVYFPNGIKENIVGFGNTIQEKVQTALDNYLNTTFRPIIDSFSDSHNPALDFYTTTADHKEILWHPKLGNINFQGKWQSYPDGEPIFDLLKDAVKQKLTSNKINWVKVYISKRANGNIIGECTFNNEPWDDGYTIVAGYAHRWAEKGEFHGLKQFMLFRRCDAFDLNMA